MLPAFKKTIWSCWISQVFFCLLSNAQPILVGKVMVFSKEIIPGYPMTDDNNKAVSFTSDTVHLVFMEIRKNKIPLIDGGRINGVAGSCGIYPVQKQDYEIGISKTDGRSINLIPPPGYVLWRIELIRDHQESGLKHTGNKKIEVWGRIGRKKIHYSFDQELALEPDIRG